MSRILILAPSGFGKTTSIGAVPEYKIKGLDPKKTYIITQTSKPMTFMKSQSLYPITTPDKLAEGKRVIIKTADAAADILLALADSPFEDIVIDDTNYFMQDYYMENAKKTGYDVFKNIGYAMGKLFAAMEKVAAHKNIYMLAHYEEYKSSTNDEISYRFKTVGKMVNFAPLHI